MLKQRLSMITLGVDDVGNSRAFYERLGFIAEPFDNSDVAFFDMGGVILGIFSRSALAAEAHVADQGSGMGRFSLSMNLESEALVDQALKAVVQSGGMITSPAQKTAWGGYSGYFEDPDQHLWEVAYNPFWQFDADGRVVLPSKQSKAMGS